MKVFSQEDRAAIREAIARAEGVTAGEVVPYVVRRCDDYAVGRWTLATFCAVLAVVGASVVHAASDLWGGPLWLWGGAPALAGAVAGWALGRWVSALTRLATPPGILEDRVAARAASAFLEEEVFATRERTGILIFLALFERQVVILGDAGINSKVEPDEWGSIADTLAGGIRQGRTVGALVESIEACGRLLAERKVELRRDDANELPDELRISDR